uniref:Serpin domain-containing protein n=1 Tax=Setaria digitata TaxID=48799 RepID=A0A915PVQ2_9BILA
MTLLSVTSLLLVNVLLHPAQSLVIKSTRDRFIEEAQADFALNLLKTVAKSNETVTLSPFSINIALAIVYAGAEGKTKQQIAEVLTKGQNSQRLNNYFSYLLTEILKKKNKYILNIANRLYIHHSFDLKQAYISIVKSHYAEQLQQVNFDQKDAVVKAADEINRWVAQQTNGKIKNLVIPSDIRSNTKLMLTNAIYFKGNWENPFDKSMTKAKIFHSHKPRKIEMMTTEGYFPYYEDENVQLLGIPYIGHEVYFHVLLPQRRSDLVDIEKTLTGRKLLDYLQGSTETKVQVEIPKFNIEKKFQLVDSLKKMGMSDAFTHTANFTVISDMPLYISAVLHKSFIEVNEEGSEAAASSTVELQMRSAPILFPAARVFCADHPHLFAITWHSTTVLFIGRIA